MGKNLYRMIVISKENYEELKRHGYAGVSFNDVVSQLLQKVKSK
jgi:predicted CopG family antitoxin